MRNTVQGKDGFGLGDGFMKPGQELVMAGYTGFSGTLLIGERKREILGKHFAPGFLRSLEEGERFSTEQWMKHELEAGNSPVTAYKFAGEGGVFAALWNLPGVFHAGIDVELRLFPVKQITVEFCELFGLNPYRLYSGNCLLMAAEGGGALVRRLRREGIPAEVVGCVTEGSARQIRHGGETIGFLERPQPDELLRLGISVAS